MSKPTGPTTLPPRPSSTNAHEPASGVASVELTASPLGVADANACPTPNEPTRNIIVPNPPPSKEKAGERAIWLIYFLFFAVWLAGYWLGTEARVSPEGRGTEKLAPLTGTARPFTGRVRGLEPCEAVAAD